ncbi:MAG TPA: Dabb family protein [Humisphaera sp.]|nr:Dabb family protein [Humisphaera sp.]
MKISIVLATFAFLICGLTAFAADDAPTPSGKKLYHVVSLKFKEHTTPDEIKQIDEAFIALKMKVPGIISLHWGDNISPEKSNHGFTQCFVLTFASVKDRDGYLVHPDHKAFGALGGPHFADVMVMDFWGNE